MPEKPVTFRQTLQMRKDFVGKSCKLHFEASPLKIVRASKQYLYDDVGQEYLDCISNTSHVGHCHSHVVGVGQSQMQQLATSYGFLNEKTATYAKRLCDTLPEQLCVAFFVSSGSEGNDLALRLAAAYTKRTDVLCLDGAYHGNLGTLMEISPIRFKKDDHVKKDWVHIAPTPDTFRGKFKTNCPNAGLLYANEVRKVILKAQQKGREIGAFISESIISSSGMVIPPAGYFQNVYKLVRESGGVVICDEVQSGLGRTGEMWGFMTHNVIPDIVTIGKPIGNGYPLAAVVTTKEIADSLGDFASTFGGNPVACAIGQAVLDVIENEKLMSSAKNVGKCLLIGFKAIQAHHPMIGEVRGQGMMVGIELVMDKESQKPAKETAEILAYKLKEKKIIIGIEGKDKNVLIMLPPLCFTMDNARTVIQSFSESLGAIESDAARMGLTPQEGLLPTIDVPLDVITDEPTISTNIFSEDDSSDDGGYDRKRARYEEVD